MKSILRLLLFGGVLLLLYTHTSCNNLFTAVISRLLVYATVIAGLGDYYHAPKILPLAGTLFNNTQITFGYVLVVAASAYRLQVIFHIKSAGVFVSRLKIVLGQIVYYLTQRSVLNYILSTDSFSQAPYYLLAKNIFCL